MLNFLVFLVLFVVPIYAGPKAPTEPSGKSSVYSQNRERQPTYDSNEVRKLYQDGDFDKAISILESALKEKKIHDHDDSVFVFKHLGVMYAANANSRERGKYYMLQLLTIEPTARIMDMYASDMIYMIFKNIQEEFATSRERYVRAEKHLINNQGKVPNSALAPKNNSVEAKPAKPPAKVSHTKTYLWIGTAVVMIGVGVAVYIITDSKPTKSKPIEL